MTLSIVRNRNHVVEEELAAFTQQVMVSNKFWK
jgi:hypothetical protein